MDPQSGERNPLPIEEISSAALAVAGDRDLAGMAQRFLTVVQSWAAPSLVACIEKDPRAEAGWRLHPELTSGPVPPAFERSIAKLVEETPGGALTRPTLIRPAPDFPGAAVKVRDTWVVPWRRGGSSGFVVLRGVARPYPANLGDAVSLVAQPLWTLVADRRAVEATGGDPPAERLRRLEAIVEGARQLAEQLRLDLADEQERLRLEGEAPAMAPAPTVPGPDDGAALEAARTELATIRERTEALEKDKAAADAERDTAKGEGEQAKTEAEGAKAEAKRAKAEAERAKGEAERAGTEAEREKAEANHARAEAGALGQRITVLTQRLSDLEEAGGQHTDLQSRLDAAETARAAAEAERDEARKETAEVRTEAADLRQRAAHLQRALGEAGSAVDEKAEGLEKALARANDERDQAKAAANQLWLTIESLQKQVHTGKERLESERAALEESRKAQEQQREELAALAAATERARGESGVAEASAAEKAREAEERAGQLSDRWTRTVDSFRSALEALRRTPFVSPTLRVSFSAAESLLEPEEPGTKRKADAKATQILFLDRDVPSLDGLARVLETSGIGVLIAHYPEEVGFFLKTQDAKRIAAFVCDVMAFRADQDLLETVRAWRQDVPHLAVLLSFKADNPLEAERAQRVPVMLAAGYLPRPLELRLLLDAVAAIDKRHKAPGLAGAPSSPEKAR